jgi:hypothetical protein
VAQREPVYEPHDRVTTPARPVAVAPATTTRTRPAYGGLAARIILTLLGAAGLIVGSFMNVVNDTAGTSVPVQSLWTTDLSGSQFVASLGFAMIVVALVAIVGMALRTGVLTSLAGAVGLAATILFLVQVNRADGNLNGVDAGTWLWGIGALLCLIGGFFGARREVVESTTGTMVIEE